MSEMDEIIAAVTNQVEVYHQAALKTLVIHDGPSQAGLDCVMEKLNLTGKYRVIHPAS